MYVLLELHSDLDNMQDVDTPYMFLLISSVLTWARTKPVDPVTNNHRLRLRSVVHIDTSASPGFRLRVVCHSYKLHVHEWSVRGHLCKHTTQHVSVDNLQ